jgi:hypothetical protein
MPDPANQDPDPRLQNWPLITFLVKKSIVNKFKYIYSNFSVNKFVLKICKQKYLVTKFYLEHDQIHIRFFQRLVQQEN